MGILLAVSGLLVFLTILWGRPLIRMWFHPCYSDFVLWKIGDVDLATARPQRFDFVFGPNERVPEVFSIELEKWALPGTPTFEYKIEILDGARVLGGAEFSAEGNECNWHKPKLGIAAMGGGTLPTGQDLDAGKTYTVVFQILRGTKAPPDAKGTLYGGFMAERGGPGTRPVLRGKKEQSKGTSLIEP